MKKITVNFFLLFFLCMKSLLALSPAVAIPCYYKHFDFLKPLLESLSLQTHLPKEVVISLSEVEKLNPKNIDALESGPWPFDIKIIRRFGVHMEGSNRTQAARACQSDIVLCIDADDIPHPQRIEAVLELFETIPEATLVLCGHAYCPGESIICTPSIPFYQPADFANLNFSLGPDHWKKLQYIEELSYWESGIHNGSPSIRKEILNQGLYWSDLKNGADLQFNQKVLQKFHTTYLIKLPLLHYYNGRSSGSDIGRH